MAGIRETERVRACGGCRRVDIAETPGTSPGCMGDAGKVAGDVREKSRSTRFFMRHKHVTTV
jgi:hypothetical protein